MTDTTQRLVAALEHLPANEQDEAAAVFLEHLERKTKPPAPEESGALYEPFRVMLEANVDLLHNYSEVYEDDLYGSASDD